MNVFIFLDYFFFLVDAIELEDRNTSSSNSRRGQVLPISDGNALITSDYGYIGPDMLDEPQRYHLDDDSDDDDGVDAESTDGSMASYENYGKDNPQFQPDGHDQRPDSSKQVDYLNVEQDQNESIEKSIDGTDNEQSTV